MAFIYDWQLILPPLFLLPNNLSIYFTKDSAFKLVYFIIELISTWILDNKK